MKYLKKDQIFDIGWGLSVFLYELKITAYNEPDKYLFKHSKNIIGRNIYNSSIEKFSLTKKFDFVSLNKVLEHTMSPENDIKNKKVIKIKWYILVEVPDQLSATKGKERELMVEHLHVFSKMS